tara:strand:+ start:6185 stop:7243 length:1059 start_codon:yes stop_codon:yes gene_type:complete
MRVFSYFVEPASYTLDLINNIYLKLKIPFVFIRGHSEAKSSQKVDKENFLNQRNLFSKLALVCEIWNKNDLIIINGYNNYPFILTFIFNILSFKKRYIAIESDTQLNIPRNIFKRIVKSIYLNVIFRSKYVIGFAGGSKTHKELFRFYGMTEDRIYLMPMMVDNEKYYLDNKIFPEVFTFLFVGRLIDTKNVDKLCERFISSFSDLNAQLIIIGGGDNLEDYKKRYFHDKIHFKGFVFDDELLRYYKNASVLVFPSSVEAWGLVINEAMSSSLPIIAHKEVGAVHDLIIDNLTGFVIEDWMELELKMMEMYSNPSKCEVFSENAEKLMKEHWNYQLYKKNLSNAIKSIKECL